MEIDEVHRWIFRKKFAGIFPAGCVAVRNIRSFLPSSNGCALAGNNFCSPHPENNPEPFLPPRHWEIGQIQPTWPIAEKKGLVRMIFSHLKERFLSKAGYFSKQY